MLLNTIDISELPSGNYYLVVEMHDRSNTLICSRGDNGRTPQLVEVTPDKRVAWLLKDWKHLGPCTAIQVLTESGAPEQPGACQR